MDRQFGVWTDKLVWTDMFLFGQKCLCLDRQFSVLTDGLMCGQFDSWTYDSICWQTV